MNLSHEESLHKKLDFYLEEQNKDFVLNKLDELKDKILAEQNPAIFYKILNESPIDAVIMGLEQEPVHELVDRMNFAIRNLA
jgi:hypothetical protein